jgi:DNA adenine methylase
MMPSIAKPVLKWAGGKRQLLNVIDQHLPAEVMDGKITQYHEPMMGGGAVFFHMVEKYGAIIEEYYISDYNWDLFVMYRVIQSKLPGLILELRKLADEYHPLPPTQKGDKDGARIRMFKRIRDEYNEDKWNRTMYQKDGLTFRTEFSKEWVRRSALTIFLNRTCFNGLYRVNKNGKFNVPHGRYSKPEIVDEKNLKAVNNALRGVHISVGDYKQNLKKVNAKSFVYFDPPYRPLPNTSSFTDYHKAPFGDSQQEELAMVFTELDKKGAKLMLSNSDPKNTDDKDDFFDILYKEYCITRVGANRAINSIGERRGKITEILVTNYESQKRIGEIGFKPLTAYESQKRIGEIGFRPLTTISAIDHTREFVGKTLKSISQQIRVQPKSGKFKGRDLTQWEKLNEWQRFVDEEISEWEQMDEEKRKKRKPALSHKTKNWAADVIEGLLGLQANNNPKKDLGFLELKTFGVNDEWNPIERYLPLTAFNWQDVNDETFNQSKIKQKIMQQLWIPIIKNEQKLKENTTVESMGEFRVGPPMIWIPTEDEAAVMAEDYKRVRTEVLNGYHEKVKAGNFSSQNKYLVPNTAGADSKEKTKYTSKDGELHENVKRRKWNLKREVLKKQILLHMEDLR